MRVEPSQVVRSPDAVRLDLPLAGPTSRMLAYAADFVCLQLLLLVLLVLVLFSFPVLDWLGDVIRERFPTVVGANPDDAEAQSLGLAVIGAWVVFSTFAEILWFVLWEAISGGGSIGKRMLGLRVMGDGGRPLTLGASLTRNFLRLVDVLPSTYLTGFVSTLVTREGKRLGDLAAGTVVVRLDRPPAALPLADRDDPDAPQFAFRRDQVERLGSAEAALLRQTLRRLDTLSPEQANEFLARAVEVLREQLGIDEEVDPRDREAFLRALWRATRVR